MWITCILDNGRTVAILSAGDVIYTARATAHEVKQTQRTVAWYNDTLARAILGGVDNGQLSSAA